eukprot:TRINITY_DN37401_c0_g1_i1.p1 TRINITY_DN37401_c0_g1~~TRINITY_DN37401_c0_g1_i1.p1  ORF type:complete len:436 (-),score=68.26 TRINITY_DN37401_c0_g1_i1:676-1983(-)
MDVAEGPIAAALREEAEAKKWMQDAKRKTSVPSLATTVATTRPTTPPRSGVSPRRSSVGDLPKAAIGTTAQAKARGTTPPRSRQTTPRGSVASGQTTPRGSVVSGTADASRRASAPVQQLQPEVQSFLKRSETFISERKQFLEAFKKVRETESMKECTFEPQVRAKTPPRRSGSMSSLYERGLELEARKAAKARQIRQSRFDEEMSRCSFRPHISPRRGATQNQASGQVARGSAASSSTCDSSPISSSSGVVFQRRPSGSSSYAAAHAFAATGASPRASGSSAAAYAGLPERSPSNLSMAAIADLPSQHPEQQVPPNSKNGHVTVSAADRVRAVSAALGRMEDFLLSYADEDAPADAHSPLSSPGISIADATVAMPSYAASRSPRQRPSMSSVKEHFDSTIVETAAAIAEDFAAAVSAEVFAASSEDPLAVRSRR